MKKTHFFILIVCLFGIGYSLHSADIRLKDGTIYPKAEIITIDNDEITFITAEKETKKAKVADLHAYSKKERKEHAKDDPKEYADYKISFLENQYPTMGRIAKGTKMANKAKIRCSIKRINSGKAKTTPAKVREPVIISYCMIRDAEGTITTHVYTNNRAFVSANKNDNNLEREDVLKDPKRNVTDMDNLGKNKLATDRDSFEFEFNLPSPSKGDLSVLAVRTEVWGNDYRKPISLKEETFGSIQLKENWWHDAK